MVVVWSLKFLTKSSFKELQNGEFNGPYSGNDSI